MCCSDINGEVFRVVYSATYTTPAALITAMSADKQLMDEVHENADLVIKQQIEKAKTGVSSKIA